ncbi:MAG: 50S ribosomal protein L13, partial [Firmicutes bacterium]|nr:50S ribosomal protein L13 [Bacillota bacterium]
MKSFIAKPAEVERKWYVVDADGKTLGRLASEVASVLRGKNKPTYTPHVDCGDYVIVINAEKVAVTGKKRSEKIYKKHTGYPGGLREITFDKLQQK